MKNIDFLPAKFREQHSLRRRQLWRTAVLLLFGAVVGSTAAFQHWIKQQADRELEAVTPKHASALATSGQLVSLTKRLRTARQEARLYAYLEHPWPLTQLLAAVAQPTPPQITLTEIRVGRPTDGELVPTRRLRRYESEEKETTKVPPAESDLRTIKSQLSDQPVVIDVSGVTTDAAAVHAYVGMLSYSSFFVKAQLGSVQSIDEDDSLGMSSFNVRLFVKPGYGQPNGPAAPSSNKTARSSKATP